VHRDTLEGLGVLCALLAACAHALSFLAQDVDHVDGGAAGQRGQQQLAGFEDLPGVAPAGRVQDNAMPPGSRGDELFALDPGHACLSHVVLLYTSFALRRPLGSAPVTGVSRP
jgi:hypothetical protein